MRKIVAINGQFTARKQTGQERFAKEIVIALDQIVGKDEFELIVPQKAKNIPELKNIKIVKYGSARDPVWEQLFFFFYVLLKRRESLNLCSIMPLLKPGMICIHDIAFKTNVMPNVKRTIYKKVSTIWHRIMYVVAFRFSPLVFTVSNFSKKQMVDVYKASPEKIIVIGNGWEHFDRIECDSSIVEKKPELFQKPYFFSLASLTPNKNFKWIMSVAQKHPDYSFLIGGMANIRAYGTDYQEENLSNVHFLGYISDGTVKYLMKNCKAFIFPSFFEGFGIPPLEALSVGAKIVVSNTSCLPEIFRDAAYYINPYDTNVDLNMLLAGSVGPATDILEQYTFKRFAKMLKDSIEEKLG